MLTQIFASSVFGIDAVPITIEVHIDAELVYNVLIEHPIALVVVVLGDFPAKSASTACST